MIYDPYDADPSRRYNSRKLRGSFERMVSPTDAHWRLCHSPWRLAYPQQHVPSYQLNWVVDVEEHPDAKPEKRFSVLRRADALLHRHPEGGRDGTSRSLDSPGHQQRLRALERPRTLYVNVDAGSNAGSLAAEMVDENGSVAVRSRKISRDWPRYPVQWASGELSALANRPVQLLCFRLESASLYSYWFDSLLGSPPH